MGHRENQQQAEKNTKDQDVKMVTDADPVGATLAIQMNVIKQAFSKIRPRVF